MHINLGSIQLQTSATLAQINVLIAKYSLDVLHASMVIILLLKIKEKCRAVLHVGNIAQNAILMAPANNANQAITHLEKIVQLAFNLANFVLMKLCVFPAAKVIFWKQLFKITLSKVVNITIH